MELDVTEEIALSGPETETRPEAPADAGTETAGETPERALRLLEAVLFAATEPLSVQSIAERLPDGVDVRALLKQLQEMYAGRGVEVKRIDGNWAFRTAEDLAPEMRVQRTVARRMSRAAIETMAILAYHQPVTRAEIEEIRGVAVSKGTLDVLFEQGWIRPRGRRQTPGKPMTWGTTTGFLDHFGLESVKDLPGIQELKAAGLLDARPALVAYGDGGRDEGVLENAGEPETAEDRVAREVEEELSQPLDPDDSAA
ncbi:MAG: SMC-Scp complex subunit ScpB [Rhodospirillales bacterium]